LLRARERGGFTGKARFTFTHYGLETTAEKIVLATGIQGSILLAKAVIHALETVVVAVIPSSIL
jgi:hypothetical protein